MRQTDPAWAAGFHVDVTDGQLTFRLMEELIRSRSSVDLLLDTCEELGCVPNLILPQMAFLLRRFRPDQQTRCCNAT